MRKFSTLVLVLLLLVSTLQASKMKPLQEGDLVVVEMEISAPTEAEAVKEASRRAVQSCAGRIFFSDKLVMARGLLEKYIDNYYEKFVYSTVTDSKKQIGSDIHLELKIYVAFSLLHQDLMEKGFLYRPKVRPSFVVFLKENLDGQTAPHTVGIESVISSWKDLTGQRPPETTIDNPPFNSDVSESEAMKSEAIRAAQKNDAEVILTGVVSCARADRREYYFETYTFYSTEITLKLIRADTGETLHETTAANVAGSIRQNQAIQLSISGAARKAVAELNEYYNKNWDHSVLNRGDYLLMFTGVNDEKLDIIKRHLKAIDESASVFERSRYMDVAVLNLFFKGSPDLLINAIEKSAYPRMLIISQDENRFEIQIKN